MQLTLPHLATPSDVQRQKENMARRTRADTWRLCVGPSEPHLSLEDAITHCSRL